MNIFKKVYNYFFYKKVIKRNIKDLNSKFGIEKDWIYRLYTTVIFTPQQIKDTNKYDYEYIQNEIKHKIKLIDQEFRKIGITEFIKIDRIEQINKLTWGIVFKYKFFNAKIIFIIKLLFYISLIVSGILISINF